MTAPAVTPVDLSQWTIEIQCEYHCDQPAVVMCKGCADKAHAALCGHHLAVVRQRFDSNTGKVCQDCHRPWLAFETHYEVVGI